MSQRFYASLVLSTSLASSAVARADTAPAEHLAPSYRPNPTLDRISAQVPPGGDLFPLEKPAEEIGEWLQAIGRRLRGAKGADEASVFATGFQGSSLQPA